MKYLAFWIIISANLFSIDSNPSTTATRNWWPVHSLLLSSSSGTYYLEVPYLVEDSSERQLAFMASNNFKHVISNELGIDIPPSFDPRSDEFFALMLEAIRKPRVYQDPDALKALETSNVKNIERFDVDPQELFLYTKLMKSGLYSEAFEWFKGEGIEHSIFGPLSYNLYINGYYPFESHGSVAAYSEKEFQDSLMKFFDRIMRMEYVGLSRVEQAGAHNSDCSPRE